MRKIFLVCTSIIVLMAACQKETEQLANPAKNTTGGMVTTSTIKGVSMIKDGNAYPNIQTASGLSGDDIGWFLDLGIVQSGYTGSPKGPVVSNLGDASLYCGGINTVTLYAGQNIAMGTLTYANDATNLYVTYTLNSDWYMSDAHLYVGTLANAPLSGGGTPSPGKFPIKSTFTSSTLAQTLNYTIPLSSFNNTSFIIAAHSSVIRVDVDGDIVAKETAWAAGTRFQSNKNWATYIVGTLGTCGGGGSPSDFNTTSNTN